MQLSVIILNYNVRYFLEQCVLSVQRATANIEAEIIVVDNNSSDESCEVIRSRFPEITLIQNSENTGFPKGNNIGVAGAKGEFICILNPDTVVAEDTFEKVLAFARTKEELGILGVRLIDGKGKFLPESKRGTPTPFVAFTKISGLYKLSSKAFGKYYAQHLHEDQSGEIDILVGAFMVMERKLYLEIGGFDENCFMYSDDIDLSYTVLKRGRHNFYFADTTVIHYKGESTIKDARYMRRFRDAMNYFYSKHFRISRAFDIFMKIGAFVFSTYKGASVPTSTKKVARYVLISDDENIRLRVENLLGSNVRMLSCEDETIVNSLASEAVETEIIFDNNVVTFSYIIHKFTKWKRKNVTFKIIPAESGFMIGSDSSNGRGEILKI
ncbi:MAG TPA: glycosyltransferase family 2 protein [Flavobacterium sp.]|jgi:GT2 family glycosyltransferase